MKTAAQEYASRYHPPKILLVASLFLTSAVAVLIVQFLFADISPLKFSLGLLLMLLAIYLVFFIYPESALGSLGLLHLLSLTLYHGVGSIFLAVFPGSDYMVRARISFADISNATLVAGLGIFAFAIAYAISYLKYKPKFSTVGLQAGANEIMNRIHPLALIWFVLIVLYTAGILRGLLSPYLETSLFFYMSPLIMTITFINTIYRKPKTTYQKAELCLVLLLCLLYLFLGGQRQIMAASVFAALFVAVKWNLYRPTVSKMVSIIIVSVFAFGMITIARDNIGRETLREATFSEKWQKYTSLGPDSLTESSIEKAKRDLGYRFGANIFLGNVHKRVMFVTSKVDIKHLLIPLNLVIPSFLWPQKLQLPVTMRNTPLYFSVFYNLPAVDYLPSPLSIFYAAGGMPWLLLNMAFWGWAIAYVEKYCRGRLGVGVGILTISIGIASVWVEKDITGWLLSIRNTFIFLIIYYFLFTIKSRQNKSRTGTA